MSMSMISYEKDEGYNAYMAGKEENDNPYEYDTEEYYLWFEGWSYGQQTYFEALYEYGQ